jgi:hypothetical protein
MPKSNASNTSATSPAPVGVLKVSKEVLVFVGVTALMSVVYLYKMTGITSLPGGAPRETPAQLAAGVAYEVSLTLITADSDGLSCATEQTSKDAHCEFKADGKPNDLSKDKKDIISPYMTVDNVLFLIPGLWQEPALQKRLAAEPPNKFSRDQLNRFTVHCKLTPEVQFKNFKVRWAKNQAWANRPLAWMGRVQDCKVAE